MLFYCNLYGPWVWNKRRWWWLLLLFSNSHLGQLLLSWRQTHCYGSSDIGLIIIGSKANIWNTLWAKRTVFARSAIVPPKVKRFEWNLEQCEPNVGAGPGNFGRDSLRGILLKRKNCSQYFQVLLLQAVVTPQWLQIAGYSRPNDPSTRCLVSILESIQSLSSGLYAAHLKGTYPNF